MTIVKAAIIALTFVSGEITDVAHKESFKTTKACEEAIQNYQPIVTQQPTYVERTYYYCIDMPNKKLVSNPWI